MEFLNSWIVALANDYNAQRQRHPFFISDWNSDYDDTTVTDFLVQPALGASSAPYKYIYGYDQASFKNRLSAEYLSQIFGDKSLSDAGQLGLALTVSPTASLYLTIRLLHNGGITRFLVLTPTYHSILTTLRELNATVIYHHLRDSNDFHIDIEEVSEIISEQYIQAIVLCDPVYSCGFEVGPEIYEGLLSVCTREHVWIVVDYAMGGAEWNEDSRICHMQAKVRAMCEYDKFVFIESTAKRLQLNGIKSSVVLTNKELAYQIEDYGTRVYGGFSLPQVMLMDGLYSATNKPRISTLIAGNIDRMVNHYKQLQTILANTDFEMYPMNSGNFTMVVHRMYRNKDVNSKKIIEKYLFDCDLLAFPTFQYSLYKENKFGFRVNLLHDITPFVEPLQKCLAIEIKCVH